MEQQKTLKRITTNFFHNKQSYDKKIVAHLRLLCGNNSKLQSINPRATDITTTATNPKNTMRYTLGHTSISHTSLDFLLGYLTRQTVI